MNTGADIKVLKSEVVEMVVKNFGITKAAFFLEKHYLKRWITLKLKISCLEKKLLQNFIQKFVSGKLRRQNKDWQL